jgi:uridine monophosphate synthetase
MSLKPSIAINSILDGFWSKGLVLLGDRVQEEYALKTPIFIDLRHKLYEDLDTLSALGHALHEKLHSLAECDGCLDISQQVIGIPDTATPLALATALASRQTSWPVNYGQMRKRPASYPGGRSGDSSYMGTIDPKRQVTLIDDVMASGRTKRWAIRELEKEGLTVTRILVVVDREQCDYVEQDKLPCPIYSLCTITELIEYYVSSGRIDNVVANQVLAHVNTRRFT